jgi:hypothetical protein
MPRRLPLSDAGRIAFGTWLLAGAALVVGAAAHRPGPPAVRLLLALVPYALGFAAAARLRRRHLPGLATDLIDVAWIPAAGAVALAFALGGGSWALASLAAVTGCVAGLLWSSRHLRRVDLEERPRRAGPSAAFEVEAIYSRRGMRASLDRTLPLEPGETVLVAQRVLRRTGGPVRPVGFARLTDRRLAVLCHDTFRPPDRVVVIPRAALLGVETTANGNWIDIRYRTPGGEALLRLRAAGWGEMVGLGARLRALAGRVPGTADSTRLRDLLVHWSRSPVP